VSESDSFIEEVTEEVRRDRLYGYVKKYGWIALVIVFGAVGTTGFLEYQKAQQATQAQAMGDQIAAALQVTDIKASAAALGEVAATAGSAKEIIELRRAGVLLTSGDKDGALAVLDAVATASQDPLYRDLAALKALIIRGADMDQSERVATLARLAEPGQSFRPLALEQQAVMALDQGDKDAALKILGELAIDSQSTDAVRTRARQILIALGGEVPASSELISSE